MNIALMDPESVAATARMLVSSLDTEDLFVLLRTIELEKDDLEFTRRMASYFQNTVEMRELFGKADSLSAADVSEMSEFQLLSILFSDVFSSASVEHVLRETLGRAAAAHGSGDINLRYQLLHAANNAGNIYGAVLQKVYPEFAPVLDAPVAALRYRFLRPLAEA